MIRRFDRVCVASQLLNRDQIINPENLSTELRETTKVKRTVFTQMNQLVGKRAKRIVSMGQIITKDMIESLPIVKKGEKVQVILNTRNLTVSIIGVAKQDGWVGGRIRIRKTEGRDELFARVQESGQVTVE